MNVGLNSNYVIVDETKLRNDAMAYCRAHGLVMTKQMILNGLNDSLFSNMRSNYVRNKEYIDKFFATDNCISVGRVLEGYYTRMLAIFKLKDEYQIPARKDYDDEPVKEDISVKKDNDNSEIVEQLKNIELSINRLGNVMMQILEKMPKQTVSNTLHLSDEKPVAKIKK